MRSRLTDAQRQDFATRALTEPVTHVAGEAGVRPQTIRDWMKKFSVVGDTDARGSLADASLADASLVQNRMTTGQEGSRAMPRHAAMSNAQRRTLRGLHEEFDAEAPWWVRSGSFVPRSFGECLGDIAEAHRNAENPQGAVDGMVSVVGAIKRLVASYVDSYVDDDVAERIKGHAQQLKAMVGTCAIKAETRGPDGALRLLNDALARWGRSGIDPERLTQRGSALVWDERRIKAEAAVEHLAPLLARHPEYCGERKVPCGRIGNRVTAEAQFYKDGAIYHTPARSGG